MAETQASILVCDDEPDVREMLQEYLERRGFAVVTAGSATELKQVIATQTVDLILLDINMPGEDGLTALRNLRTTSDVAVLMLTAASEVVDRILGLEMGADDYLGKPVDLRELEARVKAVLRRRQSGASLPSPSETVVSFCGFTLDLAAARLLNAAQEEVALTSMEFSLMKVFARNRGRVLNRDQLLELAHDRAWDPFDRSIDIRVSRLRRKIEPNPTKPEIIRTVRGIGYIFDPDQVASE